MYKKVSISVEENSVDCELKFTVLFNILDLIVIGTTVNDLKILEQAMSRKNNVEVLEILTNIVKQIDSTQ